MRWPLLLLALAACSGNSATLSVSLATAPDSHVLDNVETLRLTVTEPMQVHEAHRSSSGGFDLSLDLDATGKLTNLIVDGLDASGTVVAVGASPRFPLGPLEAHIAIYMAAPNSIAASPRSLDPARSELGAGTLSYGALLAGGRLASGAPSDALQIYSAFDHSLVSGLPLPSPRAGVVTTVGANGIAYLFGGFDDSATARDNLWRFDTTIAPAGQYNDFGDKPGYARAGDTAVPIGDEKFLVSGAPVAELAGLSGTVTTRTEVPELPPAGASVLATDGVMTAIWAGASGVFRYHGGAIAPVDLPAGARDGASVVALPGGKLAIVCGAGDAIVIDAATSATQTFPAPMEARSGCAVAATDKHLVIAGGEHSDGSVATTAELYDATTLALVATQPLVVPRANAVAVALPNGQVLIAGGTDATGAPIATLELFTPAN